MTVVRPRGAARKLGPISTGSKIVRFDIPNLTRRFTVHEDVICRSSKVFKARFQQQRQEITANYIEHLKIEHELDGQAVQVSFDWLHSGTVYIEPSVPRTNDDFDVVLLQCWEEFFDEAEAHFWAQCIDYVFVDGKRSDAMCEFVMDVFLTRVDNDWFKTEGRKWPKTFVQKLADHCLKKALSGEKTKSYEEIETAYVKLEEDRDKDGQITLYGIVVEWKTFRVDASSEEFLCNTKAVAAQCEEMCCGVARDDIDDDL
ncbi:hypothetical protein SLS61_006085 [Didymella pomorum]